MEKVFETIRGTLFHGDCIDVLASIPTSSVDLIFADPPFNLGKDYGRHVSDSMADEEYILWCRRWIRASVRVLKDGGAFYLYNLPKWNIELGRFFQEERMTFRHWIAIDIKMSLPIPGRLYPSHYSLLYYTKGKAARFNRPRVPIPVCRHCGGDIKDYGGHRDKLHPEGLNLSDVWSDIPPVRHASTKRRGANELSTKMLERVLTISTNEGDLVLDPFGGSGTTYFVAEQMKRRWIGMELGDCEPIIRRLKGEKALVQLPNKGDAGKGVGRSNGNGSATLFKF